MRKFSTAISSCVSGTGRCMNLGRRFGILREKIFGRGGSLTGTDTFAADSLSSAAEAGGASSSTASPDEDGTFSSPSAAAASAKPSGCSAENSSANSGGAGGSASAISATSSSETASGSNICVICLARAFSRAFKTASSATS